LLFGFALLLAIFLYPPLHIGITEDLKEGKQPHKNTNNNPHKNKNKNNNQQLQTTINKNKL